MNNRYPLSNLSDYEVMISSPLALYEQKILIKLYMPLVGDKAISLYQTLYSLVPDGSFESEVDKHEKIIRLMHLRSINKLTEIRNKLEAIGLLNVYYKDGLYVYYLKKPLDVENFFNNIELSTLLEYQIGHDAYEKSYLEFMMRKLDINKFEDITVWGREQDISQDLRENKHTSKPLEVQLDNKIEITSDLANAIKDADIILSVIATSGTRDVCEHLKQAGIKPEQILVNASKGIELPSLMRMSQVIKDVLPNQKLVVLSGPTLAKEVLQGKPTAACVACENIETAQFVQKACNVPNKFRLYTNTDVIGVELGGSLKNVIAIASGFAHTMNLGDNCSGTLLTRGMAEIVRVSIKLGANPSTLYGLSGMGDLIATCSSPMSRNYTVGSMLAKGKKINDILAELGSVAEGVKTSKAICELAKKFDIEVPVSNAIYEAVYTDITPEQLLSKLMNRKLKEEERYV